MRTQTPFVGKFTFRTRPSWSRSTSFAASIPSPALITSSVGENHWTIRVRTRPNVAFPAARYANRVGGR